jgi:hypothetical protein
MGGLTAARLLRCVADARGDIVEVERELCAAVFERRPEIAARAGILDFLKFGRALVDTRKDPIKLKLLRLLDAFFPSFNGQF